MMTKAEIGVTLLKGKGWPRLAAQELGRRQGTDSPSKPSQGVNLDPGLVASRTVRKEFSVVSSAVCGTWLQQP